MHNAPKNSGWMPNERPKILAVDNSAAALQIYKRMLKDQPYELLCTTSCTEAQMLCTDNIDLILLDIEMPEMDGYELAQMIRMHGQRAPILFASAHPTRYDKEEAAKLGIMDIIVKPIQLKILLEKINAYT
jgi:putative two-component system response regulator